MSVNWNWKELKGEITFKNDRGRFKVKIYNANCLGALIYEFKDKETKEDKYTFFGFWSDLNHLKNILGLSKKYQDNVYLNLNGNYGNIVSKIKLNTYYKDWDKIAKLFTLCDIRVSLYYKDPTQ